MGSQYLKVNSSNLASPAYVLTNQSSSLANANTASNVNSVAIGSGAYCNGSGSIAIGANCNTTWGVAIGCNIYHINHSRSASSDTPYGEKFAVIIGHGWRAPNVSGSVLVGSAEFSANFSNKTQCVFIGRSMRAAGATASCVGIGAKVYCSANYSTAIGASTQANRMSTTAVGGHARATHDYSTAIGYNAITTVENGIQLGNSNNTTSLKCKVNLTVTSDERDKADIEDLDNNALDFINALRPITYVFNDRQKYIPEREDFTEQDKENLAKYAFVNYDKEAWKQGTKKGTRRRVGVSAQNLLEQLDKYYHSDNYANIVDDNFHDFTDEERAVIPEGIENQLTVAYANLIPFLIKSIQLLSAKNKEFETQLAAINAKL